MNTTLIFSCGTEYTTARYFERAACADGERTTCFCNHGPDLGKLGQQDMFVFIDPAPGWPFGVESIPCPTAAYFIDVHLDLRSRLQMSRFFDAVFIAQKDYLPRFLEIGHQHAHWLPLACDPEVHHVVPETRTLEVGFVGKLGHPGTRRYDILTRVLPRYRTNDYRRSYSPRDMARIYSQSKIVFNASINGDLNMRVFEALASGALLVTDRIQNGLPDLFEEGMCYVGYSTFAEAIEKIDHYLAHDAERSRIAREGQRVALEFHTYRHRWDQIMELTPKAYGRAPARGYSRDELRKLYSDVFVYLRMPWRYPVVIGQYGLDTVVVRDLAKSSGRWLNARIPITPNAIRAKLRSG